MPRTTGAMIRLEMIARAIGGHVVVERWGDAYPKLEVTALGPDRTLGVRISPHWARAWRGTRPAPLDEDVTESKFNIVVTGYSPALGMYAERGEWRIEDEQGIASLLRAMDSWTDSPRVNREGEGS
jgi:hypothetical protein